MADLTEFYPASAQTSPNGAGRAASPATATGTAGAAASVAGAPAVWVLALVGVSLFLMHQG